MAYVPVTKEQLQEIAALGRSFAEMLDSWAEIVADAPEELKPKIQLNGIVKLRGDFARVLEYADTFGPKFKNWRIKSEAIKGRAKQRAITPAAEKPTKGTKRGQRAE
jgi:phage-related protein